MPRALVLAPAWSMELGEVWRKKVLARECTQQYVSGWGNCDRRNRDSFQELEEAGHGAFLADA
jgi:hypothetical protein